MCTWPRVWKSSGPRQTAGGGRQRPISCAKRPTRNSFSAAIRGQHLLIVSAPRPGPMPARSCRHRHGPLSPPHTPRLTQPAHRLSHTHACRSRHHGSVRLMLSEPHAALHVEWIARPHADTRPHLPVPGRRAQPRPGPRGPRLCHPAVQENHLPAARPESLLGSPVSPVPGTRGAGGRFLQAVCLGTCGAGSLEVSGSPTGGAPAAGHLLWGELGTEAEFPRVPAARAGSGLARQG